RVLGQRPGQPAFAEHPEVAEAGARLVRLVFEEEAVRGEVEDARRKAPLLQPPFEGGYALPGRDAEQGRDALALGAGAVEAAEVEAVAGQVPRLPADEGGGWLLPDRGRRRDVGLP